MKHFWKKTITVKIKIPTDMRAPYRKEIDILQALRLTLYNLYV